jgi:hypothetical protein
MVTVPPRLGERGKARPAATTLPRYVPVINDDRAGTL